MEEKILIKSTIDKKAKSFLESAPILFLGIAAFFAITLALPAAVEDNYAGWRYVFRFHGTMTGYFIWFVLGCLSLIASIVTLIVYRVNRECELQITENSVKGKTLLGKEVVLPLYMVSAYSTIKFLSVIAVATASGITKFSLIGNYEEIGKVLENLINNRQKNTETSNSAPVDELVKWKSLLDAGVISQEEFDAKKKQLLGL